MTVLKVPSLQHMARLCRPEPAGVTRELIKLLENTPTFSYAVLYDYVRDMLVLGVSLEDIEKDIRTRVRRTDVREKYLDLLPLIARFFQQKTVAFSQGVVPRYYSIDKDLQVPFAPPLVIGVEGRLVLPWFVFWKINPLADENLSLFVTIVREILEQDSDLADSEFSIVDLSHDPDAGCRTLKIIHADEIAIVSEKRKSEMLGVFAEGYREARRLTALKGSAKDRPVEIVDAAQMPLL
jgi:hypothetical protein